MARSLGYNNNEGGFLYCSCKRKEGKGNILIQMLRRLTEEIFNENMKQTSLIS